LGIDFFVIALYLASSIFLGWWLGGKSADARAYFTSRGSVPWWAVSLSVVATETSLLTVISTPGIAYIGNLAFLQLPLGYIAGRILVAFYLLPTYFRHSPESTYAFLGVRFGQNFRKMVSFTFIFTRLLADGVRLFAAAIPIYFFTGWDYTLSIALLSVATLVYTFFGGLRSVIWVDVLQWMTFLLSGFMLLFYLWPDSGLVSVPAEKWMFFQWPDSWNDFVRNAYTFPAAFFGGAILSMASHGTDHIIVQRILACKSEKDGKKALLLSGIIVFLQFALFMLAGLALWVHFKGLMPAALGLTKADELVMKAVQETLPSGLRGFFVAGLLAAAMSTLSSSLSALSSSTFFDLFPTLAKHPKSLLLSRSLMVFWCIVFMVFASSFTTTSSPVIEIGLSIAGFTYGALLGAVIVGRFFPELPATYAIAGFFVTLSSMVAVVQSGTLAWPWYTITGVLLYVFTAYIGTAFLRIKHSTP
jgi:SSS family transporter